MGDNSNMFPEYAPGTPTPAPRAGAMGTLNVRKTRQPDERSSGATMSSEHGIHESPISNIRRPSEVFMSPPFYLIILDRVLGIKQSCYL